MSNPYDFVQAPNIAGAGNYAQMLFNALKKKQGNSSGGSPNYLQSLFGQGAGGAPGAGATPAGFAPTDAELSGGITGGAAAGGAADVGAADVGAAGGGMDFFAALAALFA
jgi:hypothetical protein